MLVNLMQVKSGVWDANGVFIYTTLNHIKCVGMVASVLRSLGACPQLNSSLSPLRRSLLWPAT
jgi:hypothetical protein